MSDKHHEMLQAAYLADERQMRRRIRELEQLVKEATGMLERFCYASDVANWQHRAKALLEQEDK